MATNAIWLTVFFFFYYQHSTNLSSGQSHALAGVISCITEQALCTCECFLRFLPWKRPPCLMTMAPRLRVSSSAWAILWRALSYESSVALIVIFFWITPRHDSSSAALGGGGGKRASTDSDLTELSGLVLHVRLVELLYWCWCFGGVQLIVYQLYCFTTRYTTSLCSLLFFPTCFQRLFLYSVRTQTADLWIIPTLLTLGIYQIHLSTFLGFLDLHSQEPWVFSGI